MKISQVLQKTNIHQITRNLIKFDIDGELEGKCALGVLACESGIPELILSKIRTNVDVNRIIDAYEIPEDLKRGLPYFYGTNINDFDITYFPDNEWNTLLYSEIVFLNDTLRLTFKEIGEFLEVTYNL